MDRMKTSMWVASGVLATAASAMAADPEHGGSANPFAGDVGNAIWTIVIFGLVLVVLYKYAWDPILNGLQKREEFIRDSLESAKHDREQAEARLKEYERKLDEARADATALIDEARRDADALKAKIEEAGRAEAKLMIERAKREINLATDTAVQELYGLTGKLATDVAGKIIRKELDAATHERLIRESIEELGSFSK